MSIQNAINTMLSGLERGVALYSYSPAAQDAKEAKREDRELELQRKITEESGRRQAEAAAELEKNPQSEIYKDMGEIAQSEKYKAQAREANILKQRYMRTGDVNDLKAYLNVLGEQEAARESESIEAAISRGQEKVDVRKIKEETGFTPEEWEAMAMQDAAKEDYGNEWSNLADERVAKQIIAGRSQKAAFEAHKEALRRKQYKHTRYQGRMGGDR